MLKRNYRKEYDDYYGVLPNLTSEQRRHRKEKSNRNKARAKLKKLGRHITHTQDVDHKDGNALNNSVSNLRVQSRSVNRARNFRD